MWPRRSSTAPWTGRGSDHASRQPPRIRPGRAAGQGDQPPRPGPATAGYHPPDPGRGGRYRPGQRPGDPALPPSAAGAGHRQPGPGNRDLHRPHLQPLGPGPGQAARGRRGLRRPRTGRQPGAAAGAEHRPGRPGRGPGLRARPRGHGHRQLGFRRGAESHRQPLPLPALLHLRHGRHAPCLPGGRPDHRSQGLLFQCPGVR